jgi:hypothetical protein
METKLDGAQVEPVERRKVSRHRTLKAGSIRFNRAGTVECCVRNLSPAGACVEVGSHVGIPEDFVLAIAADNFTRSCHVIWRTTTRMGVAFNTGA